MTESLAQVLINVSSPSVASSTHVETSTSSVDLSQMTLSNERINSAQKSNSNTNFCSPLYLKQQKGLNKSSIATPHPSSTHYRQSSSTSSTSNIGIQGRPPLQALPLNIYSQTPVIVHNKDGTIQSIHSTPAKPGSKINKILICIEKF
ncbi:unnamed protein product [Brachionus calyciflorus]|uniref:Uncharacterized protein n=1 Tax=Brachionus calyciflorus TaxID=104777 RepID=A0A814E8A2_9BILA|nr:unnamed protein product [Brachionus calyciflorus]